MKQQHSYHVPIIVFFSVIFLMFLPNSPRGQETQTPPSIETGNNAPNDGEIERRIEEIFDEIEGLEGIFVSVRSGVVNLSGEVNELKFREEAQRLVERVAGVVAVNNEIVEQTEVRQRLVPVLERFEDRLIQGVDYLPLIGVALFSWFVVALFGWLIASRRRPWSWFSPNMFIADLIRQIVRLLFIVLGAIIALDIMGATAVLGTILGAAGIVGLAIGFAVRDTVENYIASILLSLRQPFRPMEHVEIDAHEGRVIRLTSRATILMDLDGNHIRIPNATVFKSNIKNYSRNPERRFTFELGVDADSVLDEALDLCLQELSALEFVLKDPAAVAWIEKIGDSNVILGIGGWIDQERDDFIKARSEAIRMVKIRLEEGGFALPEPIYRIRFEEGASVPLADMESADKNIRLSSVGSGPQKKPKPISEDVTNTGVDTAFMRKLEEERANPNSEDLLSTEAEDELE